MLNHLEGEFKLMGKPGMAKIAAGLLEELKAQEIGDIPFPTAANPDVQSNLTEDNPKAPQSDLPLFVFNKPRDTKRSFYEIDALAITPRTRNALVRSHRTEIRDLYESPDKDLLHDVRSLGDICLADLRSGLAAFRDRIIDERKRLGIADDTAVVLPYPKRSK